MQCPKCGAAHEPVSADCLRCGIVFAKLARTRIVQAAPGPAGLSVESAARAGSPIRIARAALIAGLVCWTWRFAAAPMGVTAGESVLHLPNLVFHEAGHVILGIFGRFVGVIGGSLFQFALPLIIAGAFLRQGDAFAAAVCTWWGGQNLLDVAPYIADARNLQLVLLGGRTGAEVEGHDWEYLLTQMNVLHLDQTIGLATHRAGLVMMAGALVWACRAVPRLSRREE